MKKNKIDAVADEIKESKTVRTLVTWILALAVATIAFSIIMATFINILRINEGIGVVFALPVGIISFFIALKLINERFLNSSFESK